MGCEGGQGTEQDAENENQRARILKPTETVHKISEPGVWLMGSVPRANCAALHLFQGGRRKEVCEEGSSGGPSPGTAKL